VIERREFFFLYANLSGVAELAFWHMASKLLVAPPEEPSPVEKSPTQDDQDTMVLADFEDLDFSALEQVDIDTSVPWQTPVLEQSAVERPEEYDELLDIERYLTCAYASEEKLRERMDAYYQKADLSALKAGLGELPSQMPPLTAPMSAVEMESWVERYTDADLALTELTAQIRGLSA
jgi:hypothetical protein